MRKKLLFFCFVCCAISVALMSCKTTKMTTSLVEHHTADSTATSHLQYAGVSRQQASLDSLFRIYLQRDSIRQTTTEQSTENITETITSIIDSLGREVRTEQRTINRNEARQTELLQQQWRQEQEERMTTFYNQLDSLYNLYESKILTHWNDSSSTQQQKEPAKASLSLWGRVEQWLGQMLVGLFIGALIVLFLYLMKSHIKSLFHK